MLSSDWAPRLAALAMIFVLVGAGLIRRRLPARELVRLGAIWTAIILGLWLAVSLIPMRR